jgi:CRISPR-associated protein (TIGR03986 family)
MSVTAPFDFARISRAVWFPEWADLVSHDVPFSDGWCGTIELELEAMTPLLIGGERRKATADRAGEVWPVKLADGRYGIPGSFLQGMIRNILEIACFGKLAPWIDKKRFGIRDLSPAGRPYFQNRMLEGPRSHITPLVKTGWLQKRGQEFWFKPCEMARVDVHVIAPLSTKPAIGAWLGPSDVECRYEWLGRNNVKQHLMIDDAAQLNPHRGGHLRIAYRQAFRARPVGRGATTKHEGKIVLTGHTGAQPTKHLEFFFYGDGPEQKLPSDFRNRFAEFEAIHDPSDGRKPNKNWEFYRDKGYPGEAMSFSEGGWMPIFYLGSPPSATQGEVKIESFGLAFMFKLAHRNDTHQMLANSTPTHCDDEAFDLASLIFGAVGEPKDGGSKRTAWFKHSLKRRASFDEALAPAPTQEISPDYDAPEEGPAPGFAPCEPDATTLLGPKPSYFPIYVRQPTGTGNRLHLGHRGDPDEPYATYTPLDDNSPERSTPELAGTKIWPTRSDATPSEKWTLPAASARWGNVTGGKRDSKATHVSLHALPVGTTFTTSLRIHNLRAVELGALLWALSFGDEGALEGGNGRLRHRLGMGKPYGMGSVRCRVKGHDLWPNAAPEGSARASRDLRQFMADFMTEMNKVCGKLAGSPANGAFKWANSLQVQALIKAAEPKAASPAADNAAEYMPLQGGEDSYVGARRAGHFLKPFVDGPGAIEFPRNQGANAAGTHATPHPRPGGAGNAGQRTVGGAHRGMPSSQGRTWPREVGAPVRLADGRMGEIREIIGGQCRMVLEDGTELRLMDGFTVAGPPE